MSENQPVDPAEVPVFTGDLTLLDQKVKALSGAGGKIATAAGDVHTSFGGLRSFYKAPEAEQLFATTQPVKDKALTISSDLCTIAGALGSYSQEITPLKKKLDDLRGDAVAFRAKIADDDKWREDGDLVEENNNRRNEIAEVWTQFQAAERTAHAKIVALVGGEALKVNDGSNGKGMYGYDAEALKQSKSLPWGEAVEESTPWWQVWEHAYDFGKGVIVDGVWGTIKGLGTLVGFQGWDAAGQAWKGLGQLATGLVITASPLGAAFWMADDKDLPGWIRDSRTAMKETGKALVAWDQWGSNPSRAAGAVTFNVLTTVFTGGAGGAVAGAGKAGAAAKAISFAGRAGRAIDPTTYLFKGAGAGFTKIGDVMAGFKGMGNLNVPPIPEGAFVLPEGTVVRPDGTVHLPDGTPLPPGAIEVPADTVRLPEGTAVPPGAVDLGDGMVRLPDDAPAPAGSVPLQEGTVAVPKDTPTLPPDANPLPVADGDPPRYIDNDGNILDESGKVVGDIEKAPVDVVDRPAPDAGADVPRVDSPAKVPAMAGAAVHAGDNAPLHLGGSLDTTLGDLGRATPETPPTPAGVADNTPGGMADNLPTSQAGNNLPGGGAGNNLPGGGAGDHLPANNLDTPRGTGDGTPPPPGGHGDTPPAGGGGRDVPPGAPAADNATPSGGGPEAPTGGGNGPGLPDTPGTNALDEAAAGTDDAAAGTGDAASTPPRVIERPEFMGDGDHPYGPARSLSDEQIAEIQVYRANHEDGYFEKYYAIDGRRLNTKVVDESLRVPPQLIKETPDGPWISAKNAPPPIPERYLDGKGASGTRAKPEVDADTLRVLDEAAGRRRSAIDAALAAEKVKTGHSALPEDDALRLEAQEKYRAAMHEQTKATEAYGETVAAEQVVPHHYDDIVRRETLYGPKNGNDQFDQVYLREDGKYVVVEAKSNVNTDLGSRKLPQGGRAMQGSREYFLDIIQQMKARDREFPSESVLAEALETALDQGKLDYILVKGKSNGALYGGYEMKKFDIRLRDKNGNLV
ncbi:hypothetical protein [Streptomyces sp. NPDC015131]|uniref:hypothetical protein n=1 Tax=Streptomyces sp. NPDC015131 TaxID=3364941 RepID=UPI0037009B8B